MARLVLDASVALAWLFAEDPSAIAIEGVLTSYDLVSPWVWRLEMVNAVLVRERRKIVSSARGNELLQLIDSLRVQLVAGTTGVFELATIARPHQLTAYDAAYLEVALRCGLPLYTRDKNLQSAASRVGVPLVAENE